MRLTEQQCRIVTLARAGRTPTEIAADMGTSPLAVKKQLRRIRDRIGAGHGIKALLERADECGACR